MKGSQFLLRSEGYTDFVTETATQPQRTHAIVLAVRSLWHLIAIVAVTAWGFLAWELPIPGLFWGIGALVFSVLLWALFLSPRPVLRSDRFAQSMIELFLLTAAVAALIDLGIPWMIAAVFGVIGAVLGFVAGAEEK